MTKFKDPKQVILVRTDLDWTAGKMSAQVAHASLSCILAQGRWRWLPFVGSRFVISPTAATEYWLKNAFGKVVLQVPDEEHAIAYYEKAVAAGIPASKIVDAGRTVFSKPTLTCIGIGPGERHHIDAITGTLRLFKDV